MSGEDRRVVAALACRLGGTRLWAKPLQPLVPGVSILDHIVATLAPEQFIDEVVLAIADEPENRWMTRVADELGCRFVFGDTEDVLGRLILAAEAAGATDVLRKTTESPFVEFTGMREAWTQHVAAGNDITVVDHVPLGTAVEIYTLDALRRSHAEGLPEDRSELVSNYARFNQVQFQIGIVDPPPECRRTDLRLTVDYAEDLVLCGAVYAALRDRAPAIGLPAIIAWLDERPDLTSLVAPYVHDAPLWAGAPQRTVR